MLQKLVEIYSTTLGWVMAVCGWFVSWLGEGLTFLEYIVLAVVVDLILGIVRAHRQGVGLRSEGLWKSVQKMCVYSIVVVMCVQLDEIIGDTEALVFTRGIGAIMFGSELWSSISNLAIICPQIGALSLVKRFLLTEIADKTNIDKEILENTINKYENENKQ